MNLSIEEKAIAINLAMNIDQGNVDLDSVVKVFLENVEDTIQIINFWYSIKAKSPMIQELLKKLSEKLEIEKNRYLLEEIYHNS